MTEFIVRLLSRILPWEEIGRGTESVAYMIRWVVWGPSRERRNRWRAYLHLFLRSDLDTWHDHPGGYVSVILYGGYWEETPAAACRRCRRRTAADGFCTRCQEFSIKRRWYGPGRILRRPAEHRHRVILPIDRTAWTLFFIGPKVRSWGFWCRAGFMPWKNADANLRARGHVCKSLSDA